MKASDIIIYHGKEYPIFEIKINLNCNNRLEPVWVSVESLSNELLPDGQRYSDSEAITIDEMIYFFIPDDMASKDEQAIRLFIEENTGYDI